jgi:hypothetical protein
LLFLIATVAVMAQAMYSQIEMPGQARRSLVFLAP